MQQTNQKSVGLGQVSKRGAHFRFESGQRKGRRRPHDGHVGRLLVAGTQARADGDVRQTARLQEVEGGQGRLGRQGVDNDAKIRRRYAVGE